MRFKKIKITSDQKINIIYEHRAHNGSWDEYSFTCSEIARPEFYKAMQNLAVHVIEMCELPDDYLKRIEVRGVSFSYGGPADTMGATISAQMKLDHSYAKLNLNTPHKASEMYNEDSAPDEKQLLSDDCIEALKELEKEAAAYIRGERAQGNLFNAA